MSFQDNKPTRASQDNQEHDEYDYLDSLMQDVMEPEENESAEDHKVHQESEEQSYDFEENNEYEDNHIEEKVEEQASIKKKRVPLFKQLNIQDEQSSENKTTEVNQGEPKKQEEKVVNHVKKVSDKPTKRRGLLGGLGQPKDTQSETNKSESAPKVELAKEASSPEIAWEQENFVDNDHSEVEFTSKEKVEAPVYHEKLESEDIENEEDSSKVSSNLDDMFDGMLSDLTELGDEESGLTPAKEDQSKPLDEEVSIPLSKPGMEDIKVTPDGRSLADMIPGLRSGARPVKNVVDSIKSQDEVVKVGNKKFSDNRYTKHADKVEDKRKEQDKRRKLSNKFLQKNAKFTEQEKIIMENLGVSNEQFTKLMGSKELTEKQKAEIIGLGKYGAEKHFKGRKYRTTVGDSAMLEYLAKFKFANTRILRWISNEPQGRTWRKLNRLRDNGLVEDKAIIGVPNLWAATPAGIALSGYNFTPGLRPMPKMLTISSTMGVNYLAACLWFNSVNVLNLDDFPAKNRVIPMQEDGRDRVRGEMLVSELEIRSSLGKEIAPGSTTMRTIGEQSLYDIISATVREEFREWEDGGRVGESPEFSLGNEFMWVLYPVGDLTMSYHVPDLIVRRERGEHGEPKSIAVEVERNEKDSKRYDKIMRAYKLDDYLYEKVIWVTPNTRIARALERSAKDVGFENYEIIPIITETGVFNKQDIWMI